MGGKSTSTQNTSQQTSNTFDPWVTTAGQGLFNAASATAAASPYRGYGGPTEAGFGPETGLASGKLQSMLAAGTDPGTQASLDGYKSVMGSIDPNASVASYMNPFTDATLTPTLRKINEASDLARMKNGADATMAGAWGSSGMGVQQALADRDRVNSIGDATSKAYSDAFTNAQGAKNTALSQFLSAAQGEGAMGQQAVNQGTTLSTLLAGLGAQKQQADQTGINTAIQVNDANQMGQLKQDSMLGQILAMVPKNTSGMSNGKTENSQPDNSGMALFGSILGSII